VKQAAGLGSFATNSVIRHADSWDISHTFEPCTWVEPHQFGKSAFKSRMSRNAIDGSW